MATYKKYGKKKKSREEVIEEQSTTAKVFEGLDSGANRFEDWVSDNRNAIFGVIGAIVLIVVGYLGYESFIVQPKEKEATKEMSQPLDFFNRAMLVDAGQDRDDLFEKALHGSGGYGLLDIIDNYKGTDAANMANYSAGVAYLRLKDYKKAVHHLEKFSSKDEIYPAVAKGAIGDAFVENGQPEEGLKYYEQAANIRTNSFTTPKYLLKAGMTALDLGQNDKAKTFFNKITKDYPESSEAEKAEIYLGIADSGK